MKRSQLSIAALVCFLALLAWAGAADKPKKKKKKPDRKPAYGTECWMQKTGYKGPKISHRYLKSGWASKSIAIVGKDGEFEWVQENPAEMSDSWYLSDGGVVFSHRNGVTLLSPKKEKLWTYTVPQGREAHSCQPLPDGGFLIGESGKGAWMVELDSKGKVAKRIKVEDWAESRHAFRMVRKTPEGTYLGTPMKCIEEPGLANHTFEWDSKGERIRTFPFGHFCAIRLPNGNTLISDRPT